jgi:hypothetical protein
VPTVIKFTGAADNTVVVTEDADAVSLAIEANPGGPARFTHAEIGAPVYVNPAAVACWFDGARPQRADSGVAASMSPF